MSRWDVALAAAAAEGHAVLQKRNNPKLEPKNQFQIFSYYFSMFFFHYVPFIPESPLIVIKVTGRHVMNCLLPNPLGEIPDNLVIHAKGNQKKSVGELMKELDRGLLITRLLVHSRS